MAAERAAGGAVKETTTRVATGALGDLADWVEAYCDRNEGSDQFVHRTIVPVARTAWLALRYFTEPIEHLQSDLKDETGFDWLTDADFAGEIDREACWRRPFTFAEIAAGYAVDRERPARDGGERENVTESLLAQLRDGGQRALLGRPGSGKTTICKSVAHRWHEHEDTGPVLYRKSGAGTLPDEPAIFDRAIERATARGPVLVVVEDAVRRETVKFLETVAEYAGDSEVSFLLDSRVTEWRSGDETFREVGDVGLEDAVGKDVRSLVGGEIDQRRVPPLDEREVERVVETFEAKTGKPVRESPGEILERIRSRDVGVEGAVQVDGDSVQAGEDGSMRAEPGPVQSGTGSSARPSPMLLLVYHLQRGDYAVDPEATDVNGSSSALRTNVEEAYEAVADPVTSDHELMLRGRSDLREQVGVLVNVLNASGIGVRRELVHSLAESHSDHDTIDGFLANLEGILHFGVDEGTRYHAPHPLWSTLYLEVLLDRKESEVQAREVFEAAVNALFSFVDDAERREEFREWYGRDVGLLSAIDKNSTEVVDAVVSAVFSIGRQKPKLTPLFGTTKYSELELPSSCSDVTRLMCALWRGTMYRVHGDLEQAVVELESFREIGSNVDVDVDTDSVDASYYGTLGNINTRKGDFELAQESQKRSLEIKREIGDRDGEATSLNNLGSVTAELGDLKAANDYFEQGLEINREVGDRKSEAKSLEGMGLVAHRQGEHEMARNYLRQSLEIKREMRDRVGEARSLNNLGSLALELSNYGKALEYFERSLNINNEIGDPSGQASSLGNLGSVALKQNNYDTAEEYYGKSLEINRKIGDKAGVAANLNNFASIAFEQRKFEEAKGYLIDAADIFQDIGAIARCLKAYNNLVRIAIEMNNRESAINHAETALSMIEESDVPGLDNERQTFESFLDQLDAADQK